MSGFLRSYTGRMEWRSLPWPLLVGALSLNGVGAAFIWSTVSFGMAAMHMASGLVGAAIFLVVGLFDYRRLSGLTFVLYLLGLVALVGVWSPLGITINNARRWYDFGLFHLQPSEPVKVLLVLALADYFQLRRRWDDLRGLAPPILMTAAPMLLIAAQPDVGTALVLAPLFAGLAFLGGVRVRNLALLAAAGLALVALVWFTPGALKPYQKRRVVGFVRPEAVPDSAAAYNAEQATRAIADGGKQGTGWGKGHLNRLRRLPERHTDFIFPVIAEEWGFVRTAPVVLLYVLMTVYLGVLASRTADPFGRLIIGGIMLLFGFQGFLNMAIALRLAPITGLTLPLVSWGRSSLMSTYFAFGLVTAVCTHPTALLTAEEPRRH